MSGKLLNAWHSRMFQMNLMENKRRTSIEFNQAVEGEANMPESVTAPNIALPIMLTTCLGEAIE
jgi:hypothetical protein